MTRAKGPGQSALLWLDVIRILDDHGIPYAVVGAFAASFYGVIRASVDADAVVSMRAATIGVEDFLAMKLFAGSPQDLSDAAGVMSVSGGRVDRSLLQRLTRNYGRGAVRNLGSLLKR